MKKFLKMFRYETSAGFTVALFFMFIVKTLLWIDSINESDAKYYADGLVKFGIVLLVFVIINWTAIQRYVKDYYRGEFFKKMNWILVIGLFSSLALIWGAFHGNMDEGMIGIITIPAIYIGYILTFIGKFIYHYFKDVPEMEDYLRDYYEVNNSRIDK